MLASGACADILVSDFCTNVDSPLAGGEDIAQYRAACPSATSQHPHGAFGTSRGDAPDLVLAYVATCSVAGAPPETLASW